MAPTIVPGDRVIATCYDYGLRLPFTDLRLTAPRMPERGEIVVFQDPKGGPIPLVKRVAAVAGDRVELRGGRLILNGVAVDLSPAGRESGGGERFIETLGASRHSLRFDPRAPQLRDYPPIRIPAGHFFALGDNRDRSADSRVFGPVSVDRLRARARRHFYALDWDRPPWVGLGRAFSELD